MRRILWCAAAAIALRLGVSALAGDAGVFADMVQYHERAEHLAATGRLVPDVLRGPGYPVLLATAYRLIGADFWSARVVNALLGGALTLLTGVLAQKAGAGPRAWRASAIVAAYPALVVSSIYLMPEGLYSVLGALSLMLVRHRSAAFAVEAGVVAGAAILTRSVGIALAAAPVMVWLVAALRAEARWAVAAGRVAVFAAACLLTLTPWLLFTTRVAGGPLLDATSGFNLLAGNNPRATGRLELGDEPWLRETYIAGAAHVADGNARAVAAGVAWARDNPGAWLRLAALKLGYLFGLEGREHAWLYGSGYFGPRAPTTIAVWGVLLLASFPILLVAAVFGALRTPGPALPVHIAMLAFVAATALLHVLSFGESRFHLPLVPMLAVAASLGGHTSAAEVRRDWRAVTAALVLAALAVAWIAQAPALLQALAQLCEPGGWSSQPAY